MNLIVKLFWGSLAGFLLSFLIGIFNYDNSLGAVSLAVMVACLGTFLICMTGVADGHAEEESPGEHYARCLSCSAWLNARVEEHISEAQALTTRARAFSAALTEACVSAAPVTATTEAEEEQKLLDESSTFPAKMRLFAQQKETGRNLLTEMRQVNARGADFLASALEATAVSKVGYAVHGRWRTGHAVAGQYILADQIEPQQITAILSTPLSRAHHEACAAAKVLEEDLKTAEGHLHLLAGRLARQK